MDDRSEVPASDDILKRITGSNGTDLEQILVEIRSVRLTDEHVRALLVYPDFSGDGDGGDKERGVVREHHAWSALWRQIDLSGISDGLARELVDSSRIPLDVKRTLIGVRGFDEKDFPELLKTEVEAGMEVLSIRLRQVLAGLREDFEGDGSVEAELKTLLGQMGELQAVSTNESLAVASVNLMQLLSVSTAIRAAMEGLQDALDYPEGAKKDTE
jgi:hypothetical protein